MPSRKNKNASSPGRPLRVWVIGEWPAKPYGKDPCDRLTISWASGALVRDCRTGAQVHVRAPIHLAHVPGVGGALRIVPRVQGTVLKRTGDIVKVLFRDGRTVHVRLECDQAEAAA